MIADGPAGWTWRDVYGQVPAECVLCDIPDHPSHYAHVYGRDSEASFSVVETSVLDDPLRGVEGDFDLIVV